MAQHLAVNLVEPHLRRPFRVLLGEAHRGGEDPRRPEAGRLGGHLDFPQQQVGRAVRLDGRLGDEIVWVILAPGLPLRLEPCRRRAGSHYTPGKLKREYDTRFDPVHPHERARATGRANGVRLTIQ
eukprot:4803925-Prymnesium_polylepis.2